MRVKNITPFVFGAKVTSRRPPQREMSVAVRGKLRLRPGEPVRPLEGLVEQGAMTAETFAEDDDDRKGEALYPGDFADFKLRADVLLKATCHPPRGRAVTECSVSFSVGAWSKTLRVVGRRVWTERLLGDAISDPAPFVAMPLTWANAFGGPGFAANPVGKGVGTLELPTVEVPSAPLRAKGDRPPPAGFGPISSAWAERAGKVGKEYGESYRKTQAPFYAVDFDWSHFNAAPADQQMKGYLRGDEEMTFKNLHAAAPSFSASLPGLRLRALVKGAKSATADIRMVLDTLFADLEEETLYLTWRGLTPVEEDDLVDVRTVLVASESLAEAPLPFEHYAAILEAFEKDPLEREKHLPPELFKASSAVPGPADPPRQPSEMLRALIGEQIAEMPPAERAAAETALRQADEMIAKSAAEREAAANDGSAAERRAKQTAAVRGLAERVKAMKEAAGAQGQPTAAFDELDQVLAHPVVARILNPTTEEPGPGKDFAGEDLSGQDLSGRDLRGSSFEGARLLKANLAGALLCDCNLKGALLAEADLTGADLTGADLTGAAMLGVRAAGANLSKTTLTRAILDQADLGGASLEGARGEMVVFASAVLSRVNFRGAALYKAFAMGAPLDGANFTRADLVLCLFLEMKAEGLVLQQARIERTSFARSDLRSADATDARGSGSIWSGATLDGASFGFTVLPDAQLPDVSARGASFFGADLRGARFYRAVLDGAQLGYANLASADLNKASLNGTILKGANLYDAKLMGAKGKGCDFSDAFTARARFEGS
jgi:uncharacterized protein YjbI with pentapeptide repeats